MSDEQAYALNTRIVGMAYILMVGRSTIGEFAYRNFVTHVVNITSKSFQAIQTRNRRIKRLMTVSRRSGRRGREYRWDIYFGWQGGVISASMTGVAG